LGKDRPAGRGKITKGAQCPKHEDFFIGALIGQRKLGHEQGFTEKGRKSITLKGIQERGDTVTKRGAL